MLPRLLPFIIILIIGCRTASKTAQMNTLGEDNRDVVALAYLIRDYMRQTGNTKLSLPDIVKYDTTGQVAHNFSRIEVTNWPNIWRGGYAVYFKFSDKRNKDSVKLTKSERILSKLTTKENIGKTKEHLALKFDGAIHFYYPERHYHIAEIILRKDKD